MDGGDDGWSAAFCCLQEVARPLPLKMRGVDSPSKRIVIDPEIFDGKPVIKCILLAAESFVDLLVQGRQEFLLNLPQAS